MMNIDWVNRIDQVDYKTGNKYSQYGEEILLSYIFSCIGTTNKLLVDFGCGDGVKLSNSKLLLDNGWNGLLMDGDVHGNKSCLEIFITRENILDIFALHKVPISFDLLSVDIDGNDIYVMDEILKIYSPRVIISEFNGTLEKNKSLAIEYNPNHIWGEDNYYGYSFEAGKKFAEKHGYTIIYQHLNTNLFFVRNDILGGKHDFNIDYTPTMYHALSKKSSWVKY